MAITFFGVASNPTDNGSTSDAADVATTPPSSMVLGDFVYYVGFRRRSTANLELNELGGQLWTQEDGHASGGTSIRAAWCRYDGTWDANPSWRTDFIDSTPFSAVMLVFRPTTGSNTWAVDVAQESDNFSAPSASPLLVTRIAQTSIAASTVTIAGWYTGDDNTWELATGGWSNPGGTKQFRNTYDGDCSLSFAYKIQTSPGSTGTVSNHQATLGPDGGRHSIQTFKEVSAAGNNAGPMVSQIRLKSMTGSSLAG